MKQLSDEQAVEVGRVVNKAINAGISQNQICKELGITPSTARLYKNLWREGGRERIIKYRENNRANIGNKARAERKETSSPLYADYKDCPLWNFAIFGNKCKLSAEMSL